MDDTNPEYMPGAHGGRSSAHLPVPGTPLPVVAAAVFVMVLAAALTGCTKKGSGPEGIPVQDVHLPVLPEETFPYSELTYPENWLSDPALQLFGSFAGNPEVSDAGATLGRVLFYDPLLSRTGDVSCSTCHRQERAFSDGRVHSVGVSGQPTRRNSMSLSNFRYQRRMFWDQRTNGLVNQVLQPIEHPDEMDLSLDALTAKLQATPHYPLLVEAAFGDTTVTPERVATALAQFVQCFHAHASRYDEGLATGFGNFTPEELLGKDVFFNGETRCNQCHSGLMFNANQAFINGLDSNYAAAGDGGIGELTGQADDDGRFKTVSLRNVGLTAPYMHDGRFATLREVVDFYSDGIQPHPFLDERLSATGAGPAGQSPYQLALTEAERNGLVAFLNTLNDTVMVQAWWLSDPF